MVRVGDDTRYMMTGNISVLGGETRMKEIETRSAKLVRWIEYGWLLLTDASFKAARDKRQAYFDYRLGKIYNTRCF